MTSACWDEAREKGSIKRIGLNARESFDYPKLDFDFPAFSFPISHSVPPHLPIHDRILQLQLMSVFDFLNPWTVTLISDQELRVGEKEDRLTIPELIGKLSDSIWTEVLKFDQNSREHQEREAPEICANEHWFTR